MSSSIEALVVGGWWLVIGQPPTTNHQPLNNRPVSNRRAFGNYDDAFADVVIVAVEVLASGLVKDADVRSYTHVFIDDGFADDGVFADAYPGQSVLAVIGQFGQRDRKS